MRINTSHSNSAGRKIFTVKIGYKPIYLKTRIILINCLWQHWIVNISAMLLFSISKLTFYRQRYAVILWRFYCATRHSPAAPPPTQYSSHLREQEKSTKQTNSYFKLCGRTIEKYRKLGQCVNFTGAYCERVLVSAAGHHGGAHFSSITLPQRKLCRRPHTNFCKVVVCCVASV